jgi:hypothetical protein
MMVSRPVLGTTNPQDGFNLNPHHKIKKSAHLNKASARFDKLIKCKK